MFRVAMLAFLVGATRFALAQPGALPEPPPPPPPPASPEVQAPAPPALADVLASVAGPTWDVRATGDRGTLRRRGWTVMFEIVPECGPGYVPLAPWDDLAIYQHNATILSQYCLQLEGQALLLDVGDAPTFTAKDVDRYPLLIAIADRLRPPVTIPVIDTPLRTVLFLEPTADGFVAHGAGRSRFVIASHRLTCPLLFTKGTYSDVLVSEYVKLPPLRSIDGHVELCIERANDALVVSIFDPQFEPKSSPTLPQPTLSYQLARLVDVLAKAAVEKSAPRLLDDDKATRLPRAGFVIHSRHPTTYGWYLSESVGSHKIVDGALWEEPDADVLIPMFASDYGIVVRRQACTGQAGSTARHLPREIPTMDVTGTRYLVRACIGGTLAVGVFPLGVQGLLYPQDDFADVIVAIARTRGVFIPGREWHVDAYVGASLPFYDGAGGSHTGFAVRAGFSAIRGRPFGPLFLGSMAFGLAGNNYHPGEETESETQSDSVDAIGEFHVGGGVAYTIGPVSAGLAVTVDLDGTFPGTRDYIRGVGLLALQLADRSRVELQTAVGLMHQTVTPEVKVQIGRFVSVLRTTNLLDTEGTRGWDITVGVSALLE